MNTPRRAQSLKRARARNTQRLVTVWEPHDPAVLRVGFRLFDDVTVLREYCVQQVGHAQDAVQVFGRYCSPSDHLRCQHWRAIDEKVETMWGVFDDLVQTAQLDVTQCQVAYRDLTWICMVWLCVKGSAEFLGLIGQIRKNVCRLLIHYRQWHGRRGRVSS